MNEDLLREIFSYYGTVVSTRLMNHGDVCSALVRMATTEMAIWMVQNVDGNIPQGLNTPIAVKFANTKKDAMPAFAPAPVPSSVRSNRFSPYDGKETLKVDGRDAVKIEDPEIVQALTCVAAALGFGKHQVQDGDPTNLYVKNLPGDADQLYLYKVFAPFGAVQSVHAKQSEDKSWAIGFVKFTNVEDAQKAIMGVDGVVLPDGSVLSVAVKASSKGR